LLKIHLWVSVNQIWNGIIGNLIKYGIIPIIKNKLLYGNIPIINYRIIIKCICINIYHYNYK
jgi:hypothetical protein